MIVVDTSAIIAALAGRPPSNELIARLRDDPDLHAPHVIDVELLHALRRLVAHGDLLADRAQDVRSDFRELVITRYPHSPLADRMWELRHNVTPYDAAFITLAEALDSPLITCDGRLSRARGQGARVELFGPLEPDAC